MSGPSSGRPDRRIVVAGIGSEYRRDDGAGPAVAALVAGLAPDVADLGPIGDPLDLLGLWDGADLAVVVDAVHSHVEPGTVRLVEVAAGVEVAVPPGPPGSGPGSPDPAPDPDPASAQPDAAMAPGTTSTHGIGLAGVLRLARAVGHAPARVVVVGIEGSDFGQGTGLSPAVQGAVPRAARLVLDLIRSSNDVMEVN